MKERVLKFYYPCTYNAEKEKLKQKLKENQIEFICYDGDNYYQNLFTVRKSNKKWAEIIKIINSVKSAHYCYDYTNFVYRENKLYECTNIFC